MDGRTIEIDIDRLYQDLIEHFGTMTVLAHNPQSPITHGFISGALGDIDTAYQLGNYDRLVTLALGEGFELTEYEVT